mgnify:CR=1 FL=1
MSAATANAAGMSHRRAPGITPSSTSMPLRPPDGGWVRSMRPVMQGPTAASGVRGRPPAPMPRRGGMGTSIPYENARTSPLPVNRSPSRGETARPRSRDRSRISVVPSAPAASTTTSAKTNDVGASKRVRPSPTASKVTRHRGPSPSPSTGSTTCTAASQYSSAPWATASGR